MGVVCGFCGHSDAPESLRVELKETIADLIREKNVHLFYVGNHGGFDRMVLGVLQELQASFPVMRYYVVLAYHPQLSAPVFHDAPTIFPEDLETVPKRAAISPLKKWGGLRAVSLSIFRLLRPGRRPRGGLKRSSSFTLSLRLNFTMKNPGAFLQASCMAKTVHFQ